MVSAAVRRFVTVCAVIRLVGPLAAQGVQAPPLTVHSIWGSREYASDLVDVTWIKDGKAYTAIEEDASGNTDLYRVDALTGTRQLLVHGADLVPPGGGKPIMIEEYRFATDGSKVLVFTNSARVWRQNTKGTFFVWDFAGKRLVPVRARPHGGGRPRWRAGHLHRGDVLRRLAQRALAHATQPPPGPARPPPRGRDHRCGAGDHERQRLGMGRRQPAPLDRRRQAIPLRLGARRLRSGLSLQPRRLVGPTGHAGWMGRVRAARCGRAIQGAVLHRRDRRAARPAAGPGRSRRQRAGAAFAGAGHTRRRVRSDVPAVCRHLFASRRASGRDAAARQRDARSAAGG